MVRALLPKQPKQLKEHNQHKQLNQAHRKAHSLPLFSKMCKQAQSLKYLNHPNRILKHKILRQFKRLPLSPLK